MNSTLYTIAILFWLLSLETSQSLLPAISVKPDQLERQSNIANVQAKEKRHYLPLVGVDDNADLHRIATCTKAPGRLMCKSGRYNYVINNGNFEFPAETLERFVSVLYKKAKDKESDFAVSLVAPEKECQKSESLPVPTMKSEECEEQLQPITIECELTDAKTLKETNPEYQPKPNERVFKCVTKRLLNGFRRKRHQMHLAINQDQTVNVISSNRKMEEAPPLRSIEPIWRHFDSNWISEKIVDESGKTSDSDTMKNPMVKMSRNKIASKEPYLSGTARYGYDKGPENTNLLTKECSCSDKSPARSTNNGNHGLKINLSNRIRRTRLDPRMLFALQNPLIKMFMPAPKNITKAVLNPNGCCCRGQVSMRTTFCGEPTKTPNRLNTVCPPKEDYCDDYPAQPTTKCPKTNVEVAPDVCCCIQDRTERGRKKYMKCKKKHGKTCGGQCCKCCSCSARCCCQRYLVKKITKNNDLITCTPGNEKLYTCDVHPSEKTMQK